jgi:hypothetical protein
LSEYDGRALPLRGAEIKNPLSGLFFANSIASRFEYCLEVAHSGGLADEFCFGEQSQLVDRGR